MYEIKLGNKELQDIILVSAENHEELRAIVTLAPEAGWHICSVNLAEPLHTAQEFLDEIRDKIKPKDLEFGDYKFDNPELNRKRKNDEK